MTARRPRPCRECGRVLTDPWRVRLGIGEVCELKTTGRVTRPPPAPRRPRLPAPPRPGPRPEPLFDAVAVPLPLDGETASDPHDHELAGVTP